MGGPTAASPTTFGGQFTSDASVSVPSAGPTPVGPAGGSVLESGSASPCIARALATARLQAGSIASQKREQLQESRQPPSVRHHYSASLFGIVIVLKLLWITPPFPFPQSSRSYNCYPLDVLSTYGVRTRKNAGFGICCPCVVQALLPHRNSTAARARARHRTKLRQASASGPLARPDSER